MPGMDDSDHPTDKDETRPTGVAPDRGQEMVMKLRKTVARITGNAISLPCLCPGAHFTFHISVGTFPADLDFPKNIFSKVVLEHEEGSEPDGRIYIYEQI